MMMFKSWPMPGDQLVAFIWSSEIGSAHTAGIVDGVTLLVIPWVIAQVRDSLHARSGLLKSGLGRLGIGQSAALPGPAQQDSHLCAGRHQHG